MDVPWYAWVVGIGLCWWLLSLLVQAVAEARANTARLETIEQKLDSLSHDVGAMRPPPEPADYWLDEAKKKASDR